jgi:hypothetical protein
MFSLDNQFRGFGESELFATIFVLFLVQRFDKSARFDFP